MRSRNLLSKAHFAICSVHSFVKHSFPLSLFFVILGSSSAHAGTRVLPGHVQAAEALLQPLGRLPGTNSLRLAISLPLRNHDALLNLLQRLYDPASPDYHRYLAPAQFNEMFGPTTQDYQAVIHFARTNGLEIAATRDSRMLLDVRGKVLDVEKAFHVHLQTYQHPTEARSFYAPNVEPSVDADLPILDVVGLSDFVVPRPMVRLKPENTRPVTASGSQADGFYLGSDFRNAYAPGVSLTGAGQRVGLLELDGFFSNDIVSYENLAKLPNVPVESVPLGYTGPPGSGVVEVSLDIEMAIAMAPGLASVVVFEGSITNGTSWIDILDSMASSNQIKQFSSSWGYSGQPDPNTSFDTEFQKMATQGQSFYQASGDGDAWVGLIWVPADSPYLTSVGGTMLTMSGSGAAYSSETVWNEGNQGVANAWGPNGNGYIGSGGGVSIVYSIPSWQTGLSNSANHASSTMRNIPDVALTADDIWVIYGDGQSSGAGGTSCAAPLWAGFTALVNQQAAAGGNPTVGFINPAIYALGQGTSYTSSFHDIATGNNTNAQSQNLYFAASGYDLCTGWGTPNGEGLINALLPEEALQITPSAGFVSSGPFGGPFSVTNQNFTLTNIALASLTWTLANTSLWLSASSTGGTLTSGGAAALVSVFLNSAATQLTVGVYTNTVWFTNLSDTTAQGFKFILTVSKAAPILSWAAPSDITYGQALGSSQLNATASVPGSFAYNPTNGTVLNTGANTLSVLFGPGDSVDYSSASASVSLVVLPAALTVTAFNASRPYGQANPVLGGTITCLENQDNITATYSSSATSSSAVGSYAVVPSLVDPGDRRTNYTVSLVTGTLAVTQAIPQVSWTNPAAIIYGEPLSSNQLNATANAAGSFVYSPTNGTVLNTGANVLSGLFTPSDTVDYSSANGSVSLVVSPAALTVTASNASRPYGQANPVFGGTITGLENQDNITATYSSSATSSSAVGSYAIVPSLVDPGDHRTNYNVSLVDGTLKVAQAIPQISWTNPAATIYGAALSSNQLNATASVPGSFVYNPTNGTVLNTGTNALSVLFTPSDTVDYSSANGSVSLVMVPTALIVTASNASRPYGQANPVFGGSITGLENQDNITATYSSSATSSSAVGSYAIVPSLVDPGDRRTNYNVSLVSGTLTVTQAIPQVSWTNPAAIIYGEALSSNQLNATANAAGSFVYNPTNGTVLNAGTNALSVLFTPSDTVDYSSANGSVSLVVLPAALTVTAANASRPYGQTNPVFGGTITGLENQDNITATYSSSATTSSAVGSYVIVPSLVDPSDRRTNYTVSLVDGTLTVAQAIPQVSWTNPAAITYGAALGSNQLNAAASVPGSLVYNPTNGTVLNTGTNALSVLFTPADTVDYTSANASVSLVVMPAALTVTASNASRPYGQTNPVFGGTITGLENQDNITATYSSSATTSSAVGSYAIVPSLMDPSDRRTNYTVSLVTGTLTVTQAIPQVSWTNPAAIIYGETLSSNQLNAAASVPGSLVYNPTNGTVLNKGTNALSVLFTPADTVDYTSASGSVNLVILPASLTVTASNASRLYGQTNPVFGGTITGLENQDNITATYSSSATTSSAAGSYPIVPSLVDPGDRRTNYTVSLVDGTLAVAQAIPQISWTNPAAITFGAALSSNQLNATASVPGSLVYNPTNDTVLNTGTNALSVLFTPADTVDYTSASGSVKLVILPASLTATASNASRLYGQTNPVFGGTITGLENQDNITATYSSSATTSSAAGLYAIVPSLVDQGDRRTNYTVSLVNGTLTVLAAPVILTVQRSDGSFTFTWSSTDAQQYQVQAETNLAQPNWTNLGSAFTATNSTMTTSESIGTNAQQFYRIVLLP
jgi:subtilase family serine protease